MRHRNDGNNSKECHTPMMVRGAIIKWTAAALLGVMILGWAASTQLHIQRIKGVSEFSVSDGVLHARWMSAWDVDFLERSCGFSADLVALEQQRDSFHLGRP